MKLIVAILAIIQSVLDRIPSRKESILNRIDEIRNEIKKMQSKESNWTAIDSGKYYTLIDELSKLENRAKNIG